MARVKASLAYARRFAALTRTMRSRRYGLYPSVGRDIVPGTPPAATPECDQTPRLRRL